MIKPIQPNRRISRPYYREVSEQAKMRIEIGATSLVFFMLGMAFHMCWVQL